MSVDAATTISSAFDKLYEKVPADQVARLTDFRRTHPVKHLSIDDVHWE